MTIKQMIKKLELLDDAIEEKGLKPTNVYVSSDEEWNTLFKDIEITLDENYNVVIFGLSGSELDI